MAKKRSAARPARILDARPDTLDFRDLMFEATLVEVPSRMPLESYRKARVPILDQGREGACTGYGLATVANFLLRTRRVVPDRDAVSPSMLYQMAKRYDEWPGERYEGSSARGAMKGWQKHGVCGVDLWPPAPKEGLALSERRSRDAALRPLGAYFRVRHNDLVAMHAAIAEVGILYATATVHQGWNAPRADGVIVRSEKPLGGHAFAIVAYDERGFWVQNSWGAKWGKGGFGLMSYDDWLENGTDVWVARLGVPIELQSPLGTARAVGGSLRANAYSIPELRPHIISIGNDGTPRDSGPFATGPADVAEIVQSDFPRITKQWKKKRLLLYAHGGLVDEPSAIQRVAEYRDALLQAEVYPLAFIWKTDYWTTLKNMLADAVRRRRPEGILDAAKDFMLDRLDDMLEPIARTVTGKAQWDEMKENALLATRGKDGGARLTLDLLNGLPRGAIDEIHVVGHSAGAILLAPVVQRLTSELGRRIESCALWAPACTLKLFDEAYLPAIRDGKVDRFALFTLTDKAERDDHCAHIYNKSLLYLVSNALEEWARNPLPGPWHKDGVPLLGMEKFVREHGALQKLFASNRIDADWIRSPNTEPEGSPDASDARGHGAFDDDKHTVKATLARILKSTKLPDAYTRRASAAGLRGCRQRLQTATSVLR